MSLFLCLIWYVISEHLRIGFFPSSVILKMKPSKKDRWLCVCMSAFLLEESVWGLMDSKGVERERAWLVSWSLIRALFIQWISGSQRAAAGSTAWQHASTQRGCWAARLCLLTHPMGWAPTVTHSPSSHLNKCFYYRYEHNYKQIFSHTGTFTQGRKAFSRTELILDGSLLTSKHYCHGHTDKRGLSIFGKFIQENRKIP